MRCPNCGGYIPKDRTKCPYCGLDVSSVPAADESPQLRSADSLADSQRAWEEWAVGQPTEPELPTQEPQGSTRVLGMDPERDKETRVVQPPPPPNIPSRASHLKDDADAILGEDFEQAISSLTSVYRRMNRPERLSLWTTLAAFVAAFSPWYYVSGRGYVSGVETMGALAAAGLGGGLILSYLRYAQRWSILAALLQFLLVSAGTVVAGYYVIVPRSGWALQAGLPATALLGAVGAVALLVGILARA